MDKRNSNSVSPHNKTDVEKICLTKQLDGIGANFTNSQSLDFVNLCNDNCAESCDEKNIQIFNRYAKQGQ